ncbi:MAG: hypothetical protein AAFX50_04325 [Acidobacteriota bacterium]
MKAIEEARQIMFDAPWVERSPDPEQERAAAERQLKHQLSAALDQGFVLHDPRQPELRLLNQHNQFGLVNPDNRYHIANLETPGTYVLRGRRGTSADLQIQVGAGDPGFSDDETNLDPVSLLTFEDLEVEDDDSFTITISKEDPGGNWLGNTSGGLTAKNILIRESFMDWETEVGTTWYLEREDMRGEPSPIPDRGLVDDQYERAANYLVASVKGWVDLVTFLRRTTPPDRMMAPKESKLPGQYTSRGIFQMRPDEAVIITVKEAPARYQAVQVGDLWFNGLDFCHRQTSLTLAQARPSDEDGLYRMVLSARDPGVANWLDPAGASTAFVYARWQGLDGKHEFTDDNSPTACVVPFDELRGHLKGEPDFSEEQRKEQLAARQSSALRSPRAF